MPMYKNEIERLKQHLMEKDKEEVSETSFHFHARPVPKTTYTGDSASVSSSGRGQRSTKQTATSQTTTTKTTTTKNATTKSPSSPKPRSVAPARSRPRTPPRSLATETDNNNKPPQPPPRRHTPNKRATPTRRMTPKRQPTDAPNERRSTPKRQQASDPHEAEEEPPSDFKARPLPKFYHQQLPPTSPSHGHTRSNSAPRPALVPSRSGCSAPEQRDKSKRTATTTTTNGTRNNNNWLHGLVADANAAGETKVVVEPVTLNQQSTQQTTDGPVKVERLPSFQRKQLTKSSSSPNIKTTTPSSKTTFKAKPAPPSLHQQEWRPTLPSQSHNQHHKNESERTGKLRPLPPPRQPATEITMGSSSNHDRSTASSDLSDITPSGKFHNEPEEPEFSEPPEPPTFKARPLPKSHKVPHLPVPSPNRRRPPNNKRHATTPTRSNRYVSPFNHSAPSAPPIIATVPSEGSMSYQSTLTPSPSQDANFASSFETPLHRSSAVDPTVAARLGLDPNSASIFRTHATLTPNLDRLTTASQNEHGCDRSTDLSYLLGPETPSLKESKDLLRLEMNQRRLQEPNLDDLLADDALLTAGFDEEDDESEEELILLEFTSEHNDDGTATAEVLVPHAENILQADETENASAGIDILQEELQAASLDDDFLLDDAPLVDDEDANALSLVDNSVPSTTSPPQPPQPQPPNEKASPADNDARSTPFSLSPKSSYDGVDLLQQELEHTNLLTDILANPASPPNFNDSPASNNSNGNHVNGTDAQSLGVDGTSPATSSSSRGDVVFSFELEGMEQEHPKEEAEDKLFDAEYHMEHDDDDDESAALSMMKYVKRIPVMMFLLHLTVSMTIPYVLALSVMGHGPELVEYATIVAADVVVSTRRNVELALTRIELASPLPPKNESALQEAPPEPPKRVESKPAEPKQHAEEEEERRLPMLTKQRKFPLPMLPKGKRPPRARYTSKCFVPDGDEDATKEEVNSASSSSWSQHRINVHMHHHHDDEFDEFDEDVDVHSHSDEGGLYEPAGQHLLLDISNVDPSFLLDMQVLARAMIQVTERSQLTLLSYHCHEWKGPKGVSCMGVLLESHISLHTWPSAGILSLDLFTCGSQSLLPLVPLIQELFAVSMSSFGVDDDAHSPLMRWLHKKRGFRGLFEEQRGTDQVSSDMPAELGHKSVDLEAFLLGWMGYSDKKLLADVQTKFQQVQIYEATLRAAPPLSRQNSTTSVSFGNNKMVYLDGVMRSSLHGMEAYHSALVQPALMTHRRPQRVAILGGAEGATLREVLKHLTVTEVVMIEIDEMLFDLSRQYLPEWNDCSGLNPASNGTLLSCFDDPRVVLYLQDAVGWFTTHFGNNATFNTMDKFDVIIVDALDPSTLLMSSDLEIAERFFYALTRALRPNGILVSQVGKAPKLGAVYPSLTQNGKAMKEFGRLLEVHGARKMITYSESHGQLMAPWEFRLLSMDKGFNWPLEADASELDLHFAKRAVETSASSYFDAPTFLSSYQHPSRVDQESYCQEYGCSDSLSFDPDSLNLPASAIALMAVREPFFVRRIGVFARKQRHLYPKGSYLLLDEMTNTFVVSPKSLQLVSSISAVLNTTKHRLRLIHQECHADHKTSCNMISNLPKVLSFLACRPEGNRESKVFTPNEESFFDPNADRHYRTSFVTNQAGRLPMDFVTGSEIFLDCS